MFAWEKLKEGDQCYIRLYDNTSIVTLVRVVRIIGRLTEVKQETLQGLEFEHMISLEYAEVWDLAGKGI